MKLTILFLTVVVGLLSCSKTSNSLLGSWDNKQGQILEFMKDGQALWVFYSETSKDTFKIGYKTNFSASPKQLDLTNFKVGPLTGKTLLGIVEFPNDSTFKFDAEPTSVRPTDFNKEQTQTYFKIK